MDPTEKAPGEAQNEAKEEAGERPRKDSLEIRPGFDPSVKGKRAECDGGGLVPGGRYAARQDFTGTLTGQFYDQGDPPWRWYLLTDLTEKPHDFPAEAVWCESESLFLLDE